MSDRAHRAAAASGLASRSSALRPHRALTRCVAHGRPSGCRWFYPSFVQVGGDSDYEAGDVADSALYTQPSESTEETFV